MNSTIGVVTDSHSSITQKEAEKLGIYVLPMPFILIIPVIMKILIWQEKNFLKK